MIFLLSIGVPPKATEDMLEFSTVSVGFSSSISGIEGSFLTTFSSMIGADADEFIDTLLTFRENPEYEPILTELEKINNLD